MRNTVARVSVLLALLFAMATPQMPSPPSATTDYQPSEDMPADLTNYTSDWTGNDSTFTGACALNAVNPNVYKSVVQLLKDVKTTLIEYQLTVTGYQVNPLTTNMTWSYNADKWSRVTTAHGQTLLSLAFNYGVLSMKTLTLGTVTLDIELFDSPRGCLAVATESERIDIVLRLLMRDFTGNSGPVTLVNEERVCHEVVEDEDGYAKFRDRCCYKDPISDKVECTTEIGNFWLTLLYYMLSAVRWTLLLFGPVLFIEVVENLSKDSFQYVVKLQDTLVKKVFLCPSRRAPPEGLKYKRLLDLQSVKGFPKLKDSAQRCPLETPVKVRFQQYDITVDYRRTLTENVVQVGIFRALVRNILGCKLRTVGPFKDCCRANMLHTGCDDSCTCRRVPWIVCLRQLANVILVLAVPFPYYIRLAIFYTYEHTEVMNRKAATARNGLKESFENSLIYYFTPTHPLFLAIYAVYFLTVFLVFIASLRKQDDRLLEILTRPFKDLRLMSLSDTLGMAVANVSWPLKKFGLLGCIVGLIYWPFVVPATLIICLVYAIPVSYLACRMIHYARIAIRVKTRRRKKKRPYQVNTRPENNFSRFEAENLLEKNNIALLNCCGGQAVGNNVDVDDISPDDVDSVKPKEHLKTVFDTMSAASSIILYRTRNWRRWFGYSLAALVCIMALCGVVIILSEVVGCLVEIIVFTCMGIVVNASVLLKYVMLVLMVFVYVCDCFNAVEKKYLKLNKALFGEVKGRIHALEDVTSLPSSLQENRGFKSQELTEQADYESPDDVALKPAQHWMINDLVLFVDSEDTPRIPRQLFDQVCEIRVAGVPGPVYLGQIQALKDVCKIVLFIFFVFVIVLSFSAVYRLSSTNQMLATIVGGFLPMVLRMFMKSPAPDIELGTVSFRSRMDEIIKNFCQYWPIFDLPFEVATNEEEAEDKDKVDGAAATSDAVDQLSTSSAVVVPTHPPLLANGSRQMSVRSTPTYVPMMTFSPIHEDLDLNAMSMAFMSSANNANEPEVFHTDQRPTQVPLTPTVPKVVRLPDENDTNENEVDILIYLPNMYDEPWLDEWSDIN